jgi:hypothetical protein
MHDIVLDVQKYEAKPSKMAVNLGDASRQGGPARTVAATMYQLGRNFERVMDLAGHISPYRKGFVAHKRFESVLTPDKGLMQFKLFPIYPRHRQNGT